MKLLIAMIVSAILLTAPAYSRDENPPKGCSCLVCFCIKCDCDKQKAKKPPRVTKSKDCTCEMVFDKCSCKPCECKQERKISVQSKPPLSRRVWVQDISRPGLWYWGWYDYKDRSFHYTRSEYKGALSNFSSLVPYEKTYNSGGAAWPVKYDP